MQVILGKLASRAPDRPAAGRGKRRESSARTCIRRQVRGDVAAHGGGAARGAARFRRAHPPAFAGTGSGPTPADRHLPPQASPDPASRARLVCLPAPAHFALAGRPDARSCSPPGGRSRPVAPAPTPPSRPGGAARRHKRRPQRTYSARLRLPARSSHSQVTSGCTMRNVRVSMSPRSASGTKRRQK